MARIRWKQGGKEVATALDSLDAGAYEEDAVVQAIDAIGAQLSATGQGVVGFFGGMFGILSGLLLLPILSYLDLRAKCLCPTDQ